MIHCVVLTNTTDVYVDLLIFLVNLFEILGLNTSKIK